MKNRNNKSNSSWFVFIGMAGLFGVTFATQVYTQWFRRDAIQERARKANAALKNESIPARRGEIFSRDGKVIARNYSSYQVSVMFPRCPQSPGFYAELSNAIGVSVSEIQLAATKKYKLWNRNLSKAQVDMVKSMQKTWRADGLLVEQIDSRGYPLGKDFSSIIGVVRSGAPVAGIELGHNSVLAGSPGTKYQFGEKRGEFLMTSSSKGKEPINGKSIGLTIDSSLQSVALEAVKEAVTRNKAVQGCAIVIQPSTGDVLAMANWPTFDPNGNLDEQMFSSAYQAAYEPGSMFKILTLAKALDMGVIQPGWSMNCSGTLSTDSRHSISCSSHGGSRSHGFVDMTRAIGVSCNVSASTWSFAIGRPKMLNYLDELGLVGSMKMGLPGEAIGRYSKTDTSRMQLANLGFGQAMVASPLALAAAFSMIGNGGRLIKPRLVKTLDDVEQDINPARQVVSPETANTVLQTMESVIQSDFGTGTSLRIPGYRLAGKTGTAQKLKGGKVTGYISNFVGFVPAQKPKACVVVMIDQPSSGSYYGADVAGPVFTSVARAILRKSDLEPSSTDTLLLASKDPEVQPEAAPLIVPASSQAVDVKTKFADENSAKVGKKKSSKSKSQADSIVAAQRQKAGANPTGLAPHKFDQDVNPDAPASTQTKAKAKKAKPKSPLIEKLIADSVASNAKPATKQAKVKPAPRKVSETITAERRVAKPKVAPAAPKAKASPKVAAKPGVRRSPKMAPTPKASNRGTLKP